jgi:hypothetical protein
MEYIPHGVHWQPFSVPDPMLRRLSCAAVAVGQFGHLRMIASVIHHPPHSLGLAMTLHPDKSLRAKKRALIDAQHD